MPYYRKLPSGKWQATVRHPAGHKLTKTDPLKRVVQNWAQDTEASFRLGNVSVERGKKVTVAQWCEPWQRARTVEETTARQQVGQLRKRILPYWGAWPLASIGRIDVQAWIRSMVDGGVGLHAIASTYKVFAKLMADAELEGLIGVTPCRKIELPKAHRPPPRWLTRDEYDRLLVAFDDHPHGQTWKALVAVACFTGMRPGELAGLDVGQIDFERMLIRVGQVVTKHGLRAYPKTDRSRRSVPFPPEVRDLLWPVVADKPGDAPAFETGKGHRINNANWLKWVWHPALKRAGISPVRAYVMRHTAASWLVQAGVPFWDIAQVLGHATTALVSVYAHLAPDAHDAVRLAWGSSGARVAHGSGDRESLDDISAGQSPA